MPGNAFDLLPLEPPAGGSIPDARFEVTGSPFSLLNATLSASQNLYTRRGTLVAVGGKAENAVSTLSILEPFRRAFLRIPFLYQKISSSTPIAVLISTKTPATSITVVHLDGTTDWMLAGKALVAWSGQTIMLSPIMNTKLSLAQWGSSEVRGRGLLALAGQGMISQVQLQAGESYVVHPSNVVAYSLSSNPPLPYRLKSSALRLQIPSLYGILPDLRFTRTMRQTALWQTITRAMFALRTWVGAAIWGDRLFLRFQGPTTILLQTRASRINDILSYRDVDEVADTHPGVVQPMVNLGRDAKRTDATGSQIPPKSASAAVEASEMHAATKTNRNADDR